MQRDRDGDAVGRRGHAKLVVGCRHLDGETDDLPRRGQPLHDQRQRERQQLRRLQRGNVQRRAGRGDLGLPAKSRIDSGIRLPSVSSVSRACSTRPIDNRSSTTLGGPIRASARCLSPPRRVWSTLMIASAAASWNLRIAHFEVGGRPLCRSPDERGFEFARPGSGAPSRFSHCQIGSSDVRRI